MAEGSRRSVVKAACQPCMDNASVLEEESAPPASDSVPGPLLAHALADCVAPSLLQSDDISLEPVAATAGARLPDIAPVAVAASRGQQACGEQASGGDGSTSGGGTGSNNSTARGDIGVGALLAARVPDAYGGVPPCTGS